jgi:N-acetylneuraminic acid mutarotase
MLTIYIILFSLPESFAEEEEEPSESWKTLSELPERRTSSAAVTLDDKVYVIGGLNNKDEDTNTVFVYDPSSDEWTNVSPIPLTLQHMEIFTKALTADLQ